MSERKAHLKTSMPTRKVLLFVVFIMVFNFLAAFWLIPFLDDGIWIFQGKSTPFILSDILFLEGSAMFAIGAFVELGASFRKGKPPKNPSDQQGAEQTKETKASQGEIKVISFGVLLIILGSCFIGLSIAVGTLS